MRTKLLCLLGAVAALTVPASGQADVGAKTQVFDTITLEADVVVPIAAHITVSTRVRQYASVIVQPAQPPVTNINDASSWIELRDLNGNARICWSAAPTATVAADPSDVISAATTDISCPMQLQVAGSGEQRPYLSSPAIAGSGRENAVEFGYTRPATVTSARINGQDAVLENVTITRSRRVATVPYTP